MGIDIIALHCAVSYSQWKKEK